jgi:hypothetical protein
MNKMTKLEEEVIYDILLKEIDHSDQVQTIMSSLEVKDRVFSKDFADQNKCCGFYLNFHENTLLKDFEFSSFEWDIQFEHKDSPTGGAFILFIGQQKGIKFLEATFYDATFLIEKVISDNHGFYLTK